LKRLGAVDTEKQIVSLDGDTKNSTFALTYKNAFPE
jgi:transketolase C-terminal domain/subunit